MPLSTANAEIARVREAARPRIPRPPAVARPPPADHIDKGHRYSLAQRIQALTLLSEGYHHKVVEVKTGVKQRAQSALKKKAFERGFDPVVDPRILEFYVVDGERSGRPKEVTEEVKAGLLENVRSDRSGREKSSEVLAYEAGVSPSTALNILHAQNKVLYLILG